MQTSSQYEPNEASIFMFRDQRLQPCYENSIERNFICPYDQLSNSNELFQPQDDDELSFELNEIDNDSLSINFDD